MKNYTILLALAITIFSMSACKTTKVTTTTTTTPYSSVYQHDQFEISVITGWTAQKAEFSNALNIIKGPYILYINPNFSPLFKNPLQAIATGAPGADLFWGTVFNADCADTEIKTMTGGLIRKDFYTMTADEDCKTAEDGAAHWFFSYMYGASDNYTVKPAEVNPATPGNGKRVVITMTAKPSANLPMLTDMPLMKDKELKKHMAEMTEMVGTIKFK